MNNRDRYDRGTQRQSSPGRRRRESANSTGQGLTLDLVKDLAKLRDNEPHRFPAAYERLKAMIPDLDNLITVYPPGAPPSVAGEGSSSYLGGSSFGDGRTTTSSFLSSPPHPVSTSGAIGTSGAAPRAGGASSSSSRSNQHPRASFSASPGVSGRKGVGSGGTYYRNSNNNNKNYDPLEISSISGIPRFDDDENNTSYLAADDVLLRARASRGGANENTRAGSAGNTIRPGRTRGISPAGSTTETYNGGRSRSTDPNQRGTTAAYIPTSGGGSGGRAVYYSGLEGGDDGGVGAVGAGEVSRSPSTRPLSSERRPRSSSNSRRSAAATGDAPGASAEIVPYSSATMPISDSFPEGGRTAAASVAAGPSLTSTPEGSQRLWGAGDDKNVSRSGDYGDANGNSFGSGGGVGGGNGVRASGKSEGDSIQDMLSTLPSKPPEQDVKDARCVCLHQPMVLRGIQGRRYLQMGTELQDGDGDELFDDKASATTARSGGSSTTTGLSGEGDQKTFYSVETDAKGKGQAGEVVLFVKASVKGDRGPLVYGEGVGIRSAASSKFLRPLKSGGVVFMSKFLNQGETWVVLPHDPSSGGPSSFEARAGRRGPVGDDGNAAGGGGLGGRRRRGGRLGAFVRVGDIVELENIRLETSVKTSLIMRPRDFTGMGWEVAVGRKTDYRGDEYEAWEIVPAGVPYLPSWRRQRPYLTGEFLLEREPSATSRAVSNLFGSGRGSVADVGVDGDFDGDDCYDSEAILGELPEVVQEQLLLDDLLSALMGFAGSYIVVKGVRQENRGHVGEKRRAQEEEEEEEENEERPHDLSDLEFTVDRHHHAIEQSLAYLAERVLPLCNCYVRVNRFVSERSQYEFGKVAHALSAGMRRLLREYLVLIAQLENQLLQGKLSLQRLWFYVQPSLRTMETLEALTVELRDVRGGELLQRLKTMAGAGGDEASRNLHTFLLHQASVPYLEMLETWIYHGNLNDQYEEFMVAQTEVKKKDVDMDFNTRYWEDRYQLQASNVISSLQGRQKIVLTTGKYLNVVRESGRGVDCPLAGPIPADPGPAGEGLYARTIDGAYSFASRCLMDLVVREGQLVPRLESIKHYFLLDRGDFFEHFLDVAEAELDNVVSEISIPRLESLLHLSVQMSSASHDPFKDDLGLEFCGSNLLIHLDKIHSHGGPGDPETVWTTGRPRASARSTVQSASTAAAAANPAASATATAGSGTRGDYAQRMIQGTAALRGVEALMMSYTVCWPVSLVLSKKTLTKYQLLFRHLFFAKHVQRLLSKSWRDHQDTKQLELKGLMMTSYHLRQRMLHFIQNLVYYMMVEVIEPRWHQFMDDLRKLCPNNNDNNNDNDNNTKNNNRPESSSRDGSPNVSSDKAGGTLDDVFSLHENFQDLCLRECLLTNAVLLKSLTKVMISCLHFGDQGVLLAEERRRQDEADRLAEEQGQELESEQQQAEAVAARAGGRGRGVNGGDGRSGQKGLSGGARNEHLKQRSSSMRTCLEAAKYREYIRRSQEEFDSSLHAFAGLLWGEAAKYYESHINNLCTRLDFNGYFTRTYIGGQNVNPDARNSGQRATASA